ncbi:hypothetical protein GI482_02425 [Bacillus sp. N3536]|nr:hypothetical protein GI482_02425 [Bacillus sp. N3536]
MDKILYFPTINIPKSQWLMSALFYWDKVGSIVPLDFLERPHRLDKYMRELVHAELIEQVVPEQYLGSIPNLRKGFLDYIDNNPVFNHISGLGNMGLIGNGRLIQSTSLIHMGKLDDIGEELVRRGLATKQRGPWYSVESYTASNYMTYLATLLGTVTDYTPVTNSYKELSNFLEIPKKHNNRKALKEQLRARVLEKILPVPSVIDDPYDIFRFKEKHYDELRRFRNYIEDFILNLETFPDDLVDEKIKYFVSNSEDEIKYIKDRMHSFKWKDVNLTTICSVGSPTIFLMNEVVENSLMNTAGVTLGLLGAVSTALGKERLIDIKSKPLAYAAIIERNF